jgi:hypothetical protein
MKRRVATVTLKPREGRQNLVRQPTDYSLHAPAKLRPGRLMAVIRREGDGSAAPSSLRWLSDRQASALGSPPEPASGSPAVEHSEGGRRGMSSPGSA